MIISINEYKLYLENNIDEIKNIVNQIEEFGFKCFGHMGSITIYYVNKVNKVLAIVTDTDKIIWSISLFDRIKLDSKLKQLIKQLSKLKSQM